MIALIECALTLDQHPQAATPALWALSNATAVGPSSLSVFITHLETSRTLLDAMRLHLPALTDAHMPTAMLLQHISSITSNGESPDVSSRTEEEDDQPLLEERRARACGRVAAAIGVA